MKTKYCYIPDVANFTDETRVYAVFVGTSNRELAQCRMVESYASDNGACWRIWDQVTDNFLIQKGYYSCLLSEAVPQVVRSMEFNIPAFVKHIQKGDLDLVKIPAYVIRNTMQMRACLLPAVHMQRNARRANIKCIPLQRQNLSYGSSGELLRAAGGF